MEPYIIDNQYSFNNFIHSLNIKVYKYLKIFEYFLAQNTENSYLCIEIDNKND